MVLRHRPDEFGSTLDTDDFTDADAKAAHVAGGPAAFRVFL